MSILEAIIQGIVQGLTEFLPISSSGHLSLVQHIMGVDLENLLFDVLLHIGTLLAVIAVYYKLIFRLIREFIFLIRDIFTGKFKWSAMSDDRRLLMMLIIGLVPLFLLFLPVPGTEMLLKDLSDEWATDSNLLVEGFAFLLTSILLFFGIYANRKLSARHLASRHSSMELAGGKTSIHTVDALFMGFAQCMAAVFPGLSRSGSTLSVGMMRKVDKQTALDYSFVLGIPAILAAAVLSLKDAAAEPVTIGVGAMAAGIISSAVVGFLAIKVLKWIVSSDKLHIFAIYTLLLGLITLTVAIIEAESGSNLFTGIRL